MTYHTKGPKNPDLRANFLAALELGVCPLAPANYSKRSKSEWPAWVLGTVRRPKQRILRRPETQGRKTRAR